MKKALIGLFACIGLVSMVCAWDQVNVSVDTLNVKGGTLKIDGTAVTATAAELNKMDGVTATAAEINTAVATAGAGTVAATTLTGNIAQARVTNALVTAGATIGGNIPVAAITNAAGTVGASIGGNIAIAALTNALAGTAYTTNTFTGDGVTNVIIWRTVGTAKIVHSITTTP